MRYRGNPIWAAAALVCAWAPSSPGSAQTIPERPHAAVCADEGAGTVHCTARVIVDDRGRPLVLPRQRNNSSTAAPYGPAQFLAAYNLSGQAPNRPFIAIVDTYDAPNVAADLATYNAYYRIPALPVCTVPITSSPTACFQKVDQRGGAAYPPPDPGWALEIALDVEIAHAICQNCSILLVKADTSDYGNMMAAVDLAAASGAVALSGSWGSGEFSDEVTLDVHFDHPGLAMTFSSGDSGYMTSYPAASPYVTAVGGTSLTSQGETAWILGGSGCSYYEPKPPWQKDTGCPNRTIADVAADADPNTGAAIYSSDYQLPPAWYQVGGTSLSAPLVAGVYALSGNLPASIWLNSLPYMQPSMLNDITSGLNGGRFTCGWKNTATYYLCHAVNGYDGPTGLGTPNGTGAF
jgi:subtilase family serine protease